MEEFIISVMFYIVERTRQVRGRCGLDLEENFIKISNEYFLLW